MIEKLVDKNPTITGVTMSISSTTNGLQSFLCGEKPEIDETDGNMKVFLLR